MTPKKRVLTTLEHREPDGVPVACTLTPQIAMALSEKFDIPSKMQDSLWANKISHNDILVKLGNDLVFVGACVPKGFNAERDPDGGFVDEWGCRYGRVGLYDEIVSRPLENIETATQLDHYFDAHGFPDPLAKGRFELAEEQIKKYFRDYAIAGCIGMTMFETAWYMVRMDKFLIDLAQGKRYVLRLLDMIANFHLQIGKELAALGCDVIWTGDDFGAQNGMLISPQLWRKVFKPRYANLFKELKQCRPGLKILYHSDGSIVPIIPDLIEIGLDILNPLQPGAVGMDRRVLKEKYGDKLCFLGAIDQQKILPFGSPEEVKEEVKKAILDLAPGGGCILAPTHNIQLDTSLDNIFALYAAIEAYGRYPIGR